MSLFSKINKQVLHSIIGISIMLFFPLLPLNIPSITPIGEVVIGVFLGTIYLWSVGILLWSSIISVVLLGWFGYMPMPEILKNWMGHPTVVMIFFLLILVGAFQYHKGTAYIARFFLSQKIVEGRPYVFTFVLLLGTYITATFVNPWAGVFLFLPIVKQVCEDLGFQKQDLYTKLMVILVVMAALLGFPSAYFNGTILGLNANYAQISGDTMPGGSYMAVAMAVSLLSLAAIVLVVRFIIKPDVTPLKKLTIAQLNKNPLPPMNRVQKIVSAGILLFIFGMLFPVIVPNNFLSRLLSDNITGITMTIVAVLAAIQIKGRPVLNFPEIMTNHFSWQVYFLIATSLFLGSALTDEQVGLVTFLENTLTPVFQNMSTLVFTITVVLAGVLISNVMNSVVVVLILHPILATFSSVASVDALPIVMLVTFGTIGFAAITPSASPYAATIFGQRDYLNPPEVYKYTSLFVLVEIIVLLLVGLPLAQLLF